MPIDTYFYLLERAQVHAIDQCANSYHHITSQFNRSVYEENAAISFVSTTDSYRHWLEIGRAKGARFAKCKDTLLKIVLKCKDDTEYIQTWIEYHAQIVGYHNIIVIDCGSNEPRYWEILRQYLGRILILSYPYYYDYIHDFEKNRSFYDLISKNARYIALLDADEFMFGAFEGTVSAHGVSALLASEATSFLAGTWFNNMSQLPIERNELRIDDVFGYAADSHWVSWGSTAGKAVIRTDHLESAQHIGHNLTSAGVAGLIDAKSFGKIGVLHINRLSRDIDKKRSLRHLRARGFVSSDLVQDSDIARVLAQRRQTPSVLPIDALYISRYLSDESPLPPTRKSFRLSLSQLLRGGIPMDESWADFQNFDFQELVQRRREELAEAAGC